ncbi:MAG: patatin-like phospholipase family protein [Shimia sp.]
MPRPINLALQGGGAHGAYTWGVLDRLLEDDGIEIAAMSGTSAGALNGAALKAGMIAGGREGAKENLDWLWSQVAAVQDMRLTGWMQAPFMSPGAVSRAIEYSLPFSFVDQMTRMVSPYAYGPFYQNPLQRIVERFQWDAVCASTGPALFVCATNVRSGKIRVFRGTEISAEALLASACLPTLFQAVEIDDPKTGRTEAYWDGGYTGNPALFPLFDGAFPRDIVIVNINPLYRDEVPTSPQQIQNRINEISFNTSLLRELRAIDFVKRMLAANEEMPGSYKDVLVHMIADDALMRDLSVATKLVPSPYVIGQLKAAGRRAAEDFLTGRADRIGVESSVDLGGMFS